MMPLPKPEPELVCDLIDSLNKRWGVPFDVEDALKESEKRHFSERLRLAGEVRKLQSVNLDGTANLNAKNGQIARLEREKHDLESTLHRLVDIAAAVGFQRDGTMLLSDFFYTRLNP